MNQKEIENLQARTDSKLRYAQLHLDELKQRGTSSGDDFERAHQESFLYHLIGSRDAFLRELNTYYRAGLEGQNLSLGKLREALKKRGLKSSELTELFELEVDDDSWFSHAKSIRDHSTHVSNVPRHFHLGGPNDHLVFISNPKTGKIIQRHITDEFSDWVILMSDTIRRLRSTAISTNEILAPMNQKEVAELTDQELKEEVKKIKPFPMVDAFFIGFLVGIIMYSLMANTWGFLTLIPLVIVYWLLKKPKRFEALKK